MICWNNYSEFAIWGTHFGETKDPTSIVFNPVFDNLFIRLILSVNDRIYFSFWRPSLGPTSTIFIFCPNKCGCFYLNAVAIVFILANLAALSIILISLFRIVIIQIFIRNVIVNEMVKDKKKSNRNIFTLGNLRYKYYSKFS